MYHLVSSQIGVGPFSGCGDLDLADVSMGLQVGGEGLGRWRRAESQDVVRVKRPSEIGVTQKVIVGAETSGASMPRAPEIGSARTGALRVVASFLTA